MIRSLFGLIFLFSASILSAQNTDNIMKINSEPVTLDEFSQVYFKNKNKADATIEDLEEYLELFVNFKLKVTEAKELGYDTLPKFQRELRNYRNQLSKPYLVDKSQEEELLREAFERSLFEVRASHILIAVDEEANPKDTLTAYNKALKLRNRILKGEDFTKVAKGKGGSDDPSVVENGGDLGYFSVFRMVYPFETAAFNTAVGEVSMPVRTKFGYHLIKVEDKRPSRGEIRVAHIAVRDESAEDLKSESFQKIKEIHERLKAGEEFAKLALRYSDDQASMQRGGELPWFGTGRMMENFEDIAFGLEKDGDFSEPFKTPFGWHIVKRLELRKADNFEDAEPELKRLLARDGRAKSSKDLFTEKLKKEYNYKQFNKNVDKVIAMVDTSIFNPMWDTAFFDKVRDIKIFEFADNEFRTGRDLLIVVRKRFQPGVPANLREYIYKRLGDFSRNELMNHEKAMLPEKYPEYKALLREYYEGILLFDITEDRVWSKGVKDSVGLDEFFKANQENYQWKERVEASIFKCNDLETAKKAAKLLKKKKTNAEIKEELNKENALAVATESGWFERGNNEFLDGLKWKKGTTKPIENNGLYYFVVIKNVKQPEPKKLDDARGLVISDYQNHLEKEWIKQLRDKYDFEIFKENLSQLVQP
jgi:peptidyl-prolyl cis-trans isomerase SurA